MNDMLDRLVNKEKNKICINNSKFFFKTIPKLLQ